MAWPQDDSEKKERARVARELNRQEFWKAIVVAAVRDGHTAGGAVIEGDLALKSFDVRFLGAP